MFTRDMTKTLTPYKKFPVIALLGPRQSGKTTLAQETFKKHLYTSLEDPETRKLVTDDPKKFLRINENKHGIIIDEFQYAPNLLSYIQLEVDAKKRPGYFVLTGSQNFLMNEKISQSLAGRVGIVTLLPLSLHELKKNKLLTHDADTTMFKGAYPRVYNEKIEPRAFYDAYLQTYVERDVRQLINVGDLRAFHYFIQLCAARVGGILNLSEIGGVCGISAPTAQRWISILEASYIIFLLQPHNKNLNRRLTKSPKLFFYDPGLVCSLLNIETAHDLALHPLNGGIFECFIIADLCKQYFNIGRRPPAYFWRDLNGRLEVDCIIEHATKLFPIEIKSSETLSSDFFKNLYDWRTLEKSNGPNFLVYGGSKSQERTHGYAVGWQDAGELVKRIRNKQDHKGTVT